VGWLAIGGIALLLAAGGLLVWDRSRRHPHQPQAA
jgi:LPXTG-motif cell wall-anchored protein